MIWAAGMASAAELAGDIARIHLEAIGGEARLARLESLRASGQVRAGDQTMTVQMWAARPNRIRLELEAGDRRLIQGWNGQDAPWVKNGAEAKLQEMPTGLQDDFKADADFDDPLYQSEARGFRLSYAGEDEVGGRPVVKLEARRASVRETSVLYLAADTYFIVRQDRTRQRADGSTLSTQTFYADFRPVQGVILPHRITVWAEEKLLNEVVLDWMEPNPPVDANLFAKP